MDRKGIIGLVICGLLLMAHLIVSNQNRTEALKAEALKAAEKDRIAKEAAKAVEEEQEAAEVAEGEEGGEPEPVVEIAEEEVVLATTETRFVLTNKGGGIKYAEMINQGPVVIPSQKKKLTPDELAELPQVRLNRFGDAAVGELVQGGVDGAVGLIYKIKSRSDREVIFETTTEDGLFVVKKWALIESEKESGKYRIDLSVGVKNTKSSGNIALNTFGIHSGSAGPLWSNEDIRGTGFFVHDKKLRFKGTNWFRKSFFRKARERFDEGFEGVTYAGVSNQFFVTMVGKKEEADATVWAKSPKRKLEANGGGESKQFVEMAWSLPEKLLKPGDGYQVGYEIYMGPKENKVVRELGSNRGEIMHYGLFGFISRPLNWLLNFYHDSIFSKFAPTFAWGFAIILVTFTIRILIWPLHNASTRTMKRMSKLGPMQAEIKEKYPDDPQKVQAETMKLYRDYEIRPLRGCLPMFAQIPIFFGFYNMLRPAVELRGAKFMWVDDLSLPDTVFELPFGLPFLGNPVPVNLLPILMMVTMFIQMQMSPKTGDAMQRRIFMLMPFMFFFFCYNFASALALYWTAQNIFSIGQTWWMKRQPEVELEKKKPRKGKPGKQSFMERMAAKAEEMQKLQQEARGGGSSKPKSRGPRIGG